MFDWKWAAPWTAVVAVGLFFFVGFVGFPNNIHGASCEIRLGKTYNLQWVKDEGDTYLFVFSEGSAVGLARVSKTTCREGAVPAGKLRCDWMPKRGPDSFYGKAVLSFSRPAGDAVNVLQH